MKQSSRSIMNKTLISIVITLSLLVIIIFVIYSQNTRYYIQTASEGVAYKIDRKTGKTWMIMGNTHALVGGKDNEGEYQKVKGNEKETAINKVKSSYVFVLGSAFGLEGNTEQQIHLYLREIPTDVKIIGWSAEQYDEQTFLVKYTYSIHGVYSEYPFEYNSRTDIVRYIRGNTELEKKYGYGEN